MTTMLMVAMTMIITMATKGVVGGCGEDEVHDDGDSVCECDLYLIVYSVHYH